MLEINNVLRELRERLDLTQSELAVKLGVSRDTVARIENGVQKVTIEYLLKFGSVVEMHPVDIVRRMEENDPPFVYLFRAHGSRYFSNAIRQRYENWYNRMDEFNINVGLSRLLKILPRDYGIADGDSPYDQGILAAKWLREKWHLGNNPVTDPVDLIESLGYYITGMDLGDNDLFAITGRKGDNGRPGIVINTNANITIERQRFSIIHELGHIVEHGEDFEEQPDYSGYGRNKDDREKFAGAFAGEFLVPAVELAGMYQTISGYPLDMKIIKLKGHFKVSYQTIMIRMYDTGLLKMGKKIFWQNFGMLKRKYGKSEPVPITRELEFRQERELRELSEGLDRQYQYPGGRALKKSVSLNRSRVTFTDIQ